MSKMRTPFVTPYKTLYIPASIVAPLIERLYEKDVKVNRIEVNPPTARSWKIEVRIEDFDYVDRLAQYYYVQRNFLRGAIIITIALLLIGTLNGIF